MAQAVNAAPISIRIERDGCRPSISLMGRADGSNITKIVDVLDRLANEDKRCVSLDLQEVESIDHAALECIAGRAGHLKERRRRLHLQGASGAVKDLFDRLQLTEMFCSNEECMHGSSPECCCHATKAWEMDVFSYTSSLANGREARDRVGRIAEAVGFDKCGRNDVLLAVGEAITNAIKYGSCGDEDALFTVSCIATHEKLSVSISDSGPGFDMNCLLSFEDALFAEHGRGVHCMNAVMDEVNYDFEHGTTVRMVKLAK